VRARLILLVVGVASFGGSAPVFAQGRGHGPPPVASHGPPTGSTTTTPVHTGSTPGSAPAPVTEFDAATGDRQQTFGTWLDNADINAPGEAWMSLSATYWRSSSLREVDVPSVGATVGVTPHGQFSVSVPYYHVTDPSGSTFHGFGATYLTGKFALTPDRRVRVAVSPTLEVLSWSAADLGAHRVNVVLPLSVQTDAGSTRVYGSTGYFSRGSVFGAGAAEWSVGSRGTLVATLSHSYSIKSDPASDALGIPKHRTDASSGVYLNTGSSVVFFASVGRTMSPVTETSGRVSLTGGITVNVAGPAAHTPRVP
jgi:hypothetical protein